MAAGWPLDKPDLRDRKLDTAVRAARAAAAVQTHYRSFFDPGRDEADRLQISQTAETEARAAAIFAIATTEASGSTVVYCENLCASLDGSGQITHMNQDRRNSCGAWRPPEHDSYWLVDALDGIAGYRRNLPFSCATVALVEDRKVQCGAIYAPALNELFTASAISGARLNGFPCRTSARTSTAGAMLCSGNELKFSSSRPASLQVRNFGSHALSLAYVACGRTEGYASVPKKPLHLGPWDCAAGALLVELAGGACLGEDGAPFDLWSGGLIAAATNTLARNLAANLDWTH